jgi:hypothetical protein
MKTENCEPTSQHDLRVRGLPLDGVPGVVDGVREGLVEDVLRVAPAVRARRGPRGCIIAVEVVCCMTR